MDWRDKLIRSLNQTITELKLALAKNNERIAELERQLGLDSSNNSKPPTSDELRRKPTPQSLLNGSKLPSGGQKGHAGESLKQVSAPDKIIIHQVKICVSCKANLTSIEAIAHIKRQVFDIPEQKIEVTEHRTAVKICHCGYRNVGVFPHGVTAPIQYGNHAKSLAAYLNQQQLIPEDRLQILFKDVFKLSISTATLVSIQIQPRGGHPCLELMTT